MKIHNDFTLFFRVVPSGKRVVYYYSYDSNGKRLPGRSTGEATMTAARVKCNKLFKTGELGPRKGRVPTFAEYADGWWEWDTCAYLQKRRRRYNLTKAYAHQAMRNMNKVLLPFFGKMRMDKIAQDDVERFLETLISQKLQNATINGYYGTLKTMMIEAVDRNIIGKDPTEKVGKLVDNCKEIRIITPDEFKKLFLGDWETVWENDRISYTANKLAALTGMRSSEVLGLKGEFVYEGHIFLCKQYDRFGYRDTKTKNRHNIPLPASMIADLLELKRINGDGFLFSDDGGGQPVKRMTLYRNLHKALVSIGITKEQIAERKLHLHGWRHFCNTEMLKGGLSIPQAQAITGHLSKKMTERYSHFDPAEFAKAKEVQDALLQPVLEKTQGQAAAKPDAETEQKQLVDYAGRRYPVLNFPARETA